MMAPFDTNDKSGKNAPSAELLTQYLLGLLPAEKTEELDELSISDEQFAWRLSEVENDLVDGFVRGELRGEALKRFQSSYLSSARRRQKVEFATGLLELEKSEAAQARARQATSTGHSRWWEKDFFRQWSLAATLALLLLATYLLTDDVRLRHQMTANSSQREQQLQQELARQRAANVEIQGQLDSARAAGKDFSQLATVSLLLPPPTRGTAAIHQVPVQPGTDLVMLMLSLESDDFPHYRIAIMDPGTHEAVWRSTDLSSSVLERKAVVAGVPAKLLRPQVYLAQLSGIAPNGIEKLIGNYPFSVVLP